MGQTQQRFGEGSKQHLPRHILDSVRESTEKRRGRPLKRRENPAEDYSSANCLPSSSKQGVLPEL